MRKVAVALILGCLLLAARSSAGAAPSPSDWPSLNADATHSNFNAAEKTLTAKNFLKLKVKWAAPETNVSYPIVAGGRVYAPYLDKGKVHVHVLDAATGKQLGTYTKDALGGLLMQDANLYLAGHTLQSIDPLTGDSIARVATTPSVKGSVFLNPVTDHKVIVVGYTAPKVPASLYTVDPTADTLGRKMASASALGAISSGRILTETAGGSAFYDERSGKALSSQPFIRSNWFAGTTLAYTVASVKGKNTTLYAYDGSGHSIWHRTVAQPLAVQDWPHAVGPSAVYVEIMKPQPGIQALDPLTGKVIWSRSMPNVQHIVLANGILYALTYGLGESVRLVTLKADTGVPIGSIVLSSGYYAFPAANGLIIADGMVFLRVAAASGAQVLVGLGL
ncbi:MAG TPA: PQQ-binding-like beta-propeller repeat protein [Chloroflexota bacterium]